MSPAAIIDTNVVASGLVTSNPDSLQAKILDGMLKGRFCFLLSSALFEEYRDVLTRPKLRKYHRRTEEQIAGILQAIRGQATRCRALSTSGSGAAGNPAEPAE